VLGTEEQKLHYLSGHNMTRKRCIVFRISLLATVAILLGLTGSKGVVFRTSHTRLSCSSFAFCP
jgi:hypothetical protein